MRIPLKTNREIQFKTSQVFSWNASHIFPSEAGQLLQLHAGIGCFENDVRGSWRVAFQSFRPPWPTAQYRPKAAARPSTIRVTTLPLSQPISKPLESQR